MEEQSNEALWYVVHTYSGYENKVANDLQTMVENRHLQDLICDIKVPVEMVPEIDKNGKQKMVEHKLFPGYVLVKMVMNDDTWYVVRNTRAVHDYGTHRQSGECFHRPFPSDGFRRFHPFGHAVQKQDPQ